MRTNGTGKRGDRGVVWPRVSISSGFDGSLIFSAATAGPSRKRFYDDHIEITVHGLSFITVKVDVVRCHAIVPRKRPVRYFAIFTTTITHYLYMYVYLFILTERLRGIVSRYETNGKIAFYIDRVKSEQTVSVYMCTRTAFNCSGDFSRSYVSVRWFP